MYVSPIADALRKRLNAPNRTFGIEIEAVHPQQRIIPLSYSSHVRGWHPVRSDHPPVAFESKLECRVISALAEFPELIRIQSQPVTVPYWYEGRICRYTPDFLVNLSSVPKVLARLGFRLETFVEVKPLLRAMTAEGKLAQKFSVIREAMARPIVLVTDWDLVPIGREVRHDA